MKRDLNFCGLIGVGLGLAIFTGAIRVRSMIPVLLPGFVLAFAAFMVLLVIALLEMPMMVFALRKLAKSTMPRAVTASGFALYTMFAAIYASILVLLTDISYYYFGAILAGLAILRFASGIWIK